MHHGYNIDPRRTPPQSSADPEGIDWGVVTILILIMVICVAVLFLRKK